MWVLELAQEVGLFVLISESIDQKPTIWNTKKMRTAFCLIYLLLGASFVKPDPLLNEAPNILLIVLDGNGPLIIVVRTSKSSLTS